MNMASSVGTRLSSASGRRTSSVAVLSLGGGAAAGAAAESVISGAGAARRRTTTVDMVSDALLLLHAKAPPRAGAAACGLASALPSAASACASLPADGLDSDRPRRSAGASANGPIRQEAAAAAGRRRGFCRRPGPCSRPLPQRALADRG